MSCLVPTSPLDSEYTLKSSKIMIIDDYAVNVKVLKAHLEAAGYRNFVTLTDSTQALTRIWTEFPDLILLDIMMPEVSGLDILRELRGLQEFSRLPILVLTGTESRELKTEALELGATDTLSKPIDFEDLLPRVRNSLQMKSYEDNLKAQVRQRTAELEHAQREIIQCLARAAEFRDNETGAHVIRVGKFAGIIADELGMDDATITLLTQAATLHDVGKIGIPDEILHKKGRFNPEEMQVMRRHCVFGRQVLENVIAPDDSRLSSHTTMGADIMSMCSSPAITMARTVALTHHEKWDGTGYPLGLAGESIPIEGRITAVADVFDALSSKRPYKPAFPLEECLRILKEERGKHFDPAVVDAFLRRVPDIVAVQLEHYDV